MKKGWQTHRLEEVCREITDGSHFSPKTSDKGYPYVTVRDIDNDVVDFSNCKFITPSDYHQLLKNGCRPNKGDVLFSKDGTVGKVALIDYDKDFVVLSSLAIIRPDNSRINSTFLKWVLKSPAFLDEAVGKKTGAAIRRIILRNLKSIRIPVPPLAEQQRIVGLLDEAFEGLATAKANAEKNLQNARALFESHLQSIFTQQGPGWRIQTLDSACELFVDSAHRTPKYQDEGNPALRPRDVVDGKLNLANARRVSEAEYEIQSKRHKPSPGDIVYSRELSYGWAAVLPETPRVCLSQGMCLFRPSSKLDTSFLIYVLNGPVGREQATRAAVGAAHPHINLGDIKSYSIPVPPLDKQHKITRQLDALAAETQRLTQLYEQKQTALAALKKSLLHQAFSGEL